MMKKFLILMLVLGLASSASAALIMDIEVGGVDYAGETLAIGTTVTVKFAESGAADTTGAGGTFETSYVGTGLSMTDTTGTPVYGPTYDPGTGNFSRGGWDWLLNGGITVTTAGDVRVSKTGGVSGGTAGTPGVGTPLEEISTDMTATWQTVTAYSSTAEFTFGTTVTGSVAFTGGSWNSAPMTGSELITVVPEPITIALLGLGGLFLRRRK